MAGGATLIFDTELVAVNGKTGGGKAADNDSELQMKDQLSSTIPRLRNCDETVKALPRSVITLDCILS